MIVLLGCFGRLLTTCYATEYVGTTMTVIFMEPVLEFQALPGVGISLWLKKKEIIHFGPLQ